MEPESGKVKGDSISRAVPQDQAATSVETALCLEELGQGHSGAVVGTPALKGLGVGLNYMIFEAFQNLNFMILRIKIG